MKFTIKTNIPKNYLMVMEAFDRALFEYLKPIGAKLEIVEFTGSRKGDVVHIKFLKPFKATWISDITAHGKNQEEAYFVDEGRIIPWPIKRWKHRHVVKNINENESVIEDQIEYFTANVLIDILMLPILYLGFYPRKFQYKKYFK